MVFGFATGGREESGEPGTMTAKNTNKRGRPMKSVEEREDEQRLRVMLLSFSIGSEWLRENHKKFRTPSGREKLLKEAKHLRSKAENKEVGASHWVNHQDVYSKCRN